VFRCVGLGEGVGDERAEGFRLPAHEDVRRDFRVGCNPIPKGYIPTDHGFCGTTVPQIDRMATAAASDPA
jgi:hypothetical protein